MSRYRWGPEGPPLEAYERVTNPERFAPLHNLAAELMARLELEFDVERAEGDSLDPELEDGHKLARPGIALQPRDVGAAPIAIIFSTFPGVHVRFGRWCTSAFPTCGCDACDESAEGEAERLESLIDDLTAGRFREAIRIPVLGTGWKESEFWSPRGRSAQQSRLDPARARQLIAGVNRASYEWGPWPKRS
jgi:hypothetical protein